MSDLARALTDVAIERGRQLKKWGVQDHEPYHWMTILGEEFGEACQAAMEENGNLFDAARAYREELVQVAAVAVAAIESHDRLMKKLEGVV